VKPEDLNLINILFSSVGTSQDVPESLMNAISGLSGCGPAFVSCCNIMLYLKEKSYI